MTLATRLADYIEGLTISQGSATPARSLPCCPGSGGILRGAFKPGVMDAALSL